MLRRRARMARESANSGSGNVTKEDRRTGSHPALRAFATSSFRRYLRTCPANSSATLQRRGCCGTVSEQPAAGRHGSPHLPEGLLVLLDVLEYVEGPDGVEAAGERNVQRAHLYEWDPRQPTTRDLEALRVQLRSHDVEAREPLVYRRKHETRSASDFEESARAVEVRSQSPDDRVVA